uniref:Uncharacterized protein n=1 Tax=Candidatus Kentrum sp. UNK TaxID=2126344 RepID=A0A451ASX6_9GAMM|nr:MAG: hypothetical protein BECKUNK1418G_GA0071005_13151 [Candidatus Kentron sp. UNK]VFK73777.1 MAG: hypothetical protein BECKUNK1418H_GA0071006_12871 [Candidatus Kentron sp. UNK]
MKKTIEIHLFLRNDPELGPVYTLKKIPAQCFIFEANGQLFEFGYHRRIFGSWPSDEENRWALTHIETGMVFEKFPCKPKSIRAAREAVAEKFAFHGFDGVISAIDRMKRMRADLPCEALPND